MAQENDTGLKSLDVDGAIPKYARVHISSGKFSLSGAGDMSLGTLTQESFAANEGRTARLRNHPGTRKMIAAKAIAVGDKVYGAAGGKVTDQVGGQFEGVAISAGSADGSIIEVYYDPALQMSDAATLASAGSAQGDAAAIVNTVTSVTGADGTKGVVLPAAAAGIGPLYVYNSVATNGLKIYPASGDDINDGTADAAITIEGKTLAIFVPIDAATWAALFTANT